VCNHPDLFEGRPIVSSFDMWGLTLPVPSAATRVSHGGLQALCENCETISAARDCADNMAMHTPLVWLPRSALSCQRMPAASCLQCTH
jgi:hypothetical protein